MPSDLEPLLAAILQDDPPQVTRRLAAHSTLATCRVEQARLYQAGIFHWLYVGDTALHLAAAGYRVEIAQSLLAAGADPNAAANHRRSGPLHYAADGFITGPAWNAEHQVATIRCLLKAGAHVNAQDKNGAAPLHRAVRTRCAAVVECLLQAGADPGLPNRSGSTPFHLAVQNTGRGGSGADAAKAAQRQIIQALLAAGASPDLEDGQGRTAQEAAKSIWVKELLSADASQKESKR